MICLWSVCARGVDSHLPNASRIWDWQVKIQTHSPVWQIFSLSLLPFVYFWPGVFWLGEWKSWTTGQFGECFEKLIHTPACALHDVVSACSACCCHQGSSSGVSGSGEEEGNASVLSIKERVQQMNKISSESDLQHANRPPPRKSKV
jgi:hypothetical protein